MELADRPGDSRPNTIQVGKRQRCKYNTSLHEANDVKAFSRRISSLQKGVSNSEFLQTERPLTKPNFQKLCCLQIKLILDSRSRIAILSNPLLSCRYIDLREFARSSPTYNHRLSLSVIGFVLCTPILVMRFVLESLVVHKHEV